MLTPYNDKLVTTMICITAGVLSETINRNQLVVVIDQQPETAVNARVADKALQNGGRKLHLPAIPCGADHLTDRALIVTLVLFR
jgi:hypothetical protein